MITDKQYLHDYPTLIAICTATSLAALLYDYAVTAHSLFGYPVPVEDEEDVNDLNPTQCEIK